jgi:UDP-N-acetylglucosamine acyltransferase
MPSIHNTAIVDPNAEVAPDVAIGAYSVIGPKVSLASGVSIGSHVVVTGNTTVAENTRIFPFAAIGHDPQDQKYKGEDTRLVIGRNNVIREHVTMHPGTVNGKAVTTVGDNCLFMVNSHVAHDCTVGSHVIMANNAVMGGHVTIGEYVIIGGNSAIHQFVRIGRHAMIGGMSGTESDVIPYGSVLGVRGGLSGLNLIGIKRRGFSREQVRSLRTAYRLLFAEEGRFEERLADVAEMFADNEGVMEIVKFIRAPSSRPLCQPRPSRAAA